MISWVTPLLVLPGVGLLVMSTSARFARLHDELHRHIEMDEQSPHSVELLLHRAHLFRNALLALYGAIALLATAGLAGGLSMPAWLSSLLLGLGVTLLVVASLLLMRETTLTLDILEQDARLHRESANP